ncbi:MAG: HmuY family protein, partial [Bacteroidota bacterium]
MKNLSIAALACLFAANLSAQTNQTIATGSGYQKQSYVKLSAGTEKQVANTIWDIGFSVFGQQDAGVFVNESEGSSMGVSLPEVELYDALTDNFDEQPDPAFLEIFRLYNTEKSWNYGGFNEVRDTANALDFGWGLLNTQTGQITGNRVYVVKLRNGDYRKIKIESLAGGVYTFKYANLDGTNTVTKTVNKADFAGKTMAYFSFATGNFADVEPAGGYDLVYCRYITPLFDPGSGTYIPYGVTGILSGRGGQVAQANNVNPATVQFADFQDSLRADIDVIGYDWKSFSGTSWSLVPNLVYFLKTAESRVWKLRFTTFEGSTTGKTTFQKTDLGIISAVQDAAALGMEALVYPNPVQDELTVALDKIPANMHKSARLEVVDLNGRLLVSQQVTLGQGFQVFRMPAGTWSAGVYG